MIITTYREFKIGEIYRKEWKFLGKTVKTPFVILRPATKEEYYNFCMKEFGRIDIESFDYHYEVSLD